MHDKLVARYYREDGTITIYRIGKWACKLVEFDVEDKYLWNLPPFVQWEQMDYGYQLYFDIVTIINKI